MLRMTNEPIKTRPMQTNPPVANGPIPADLVASFPSFGIVELNAQASTTTHPRNVQPRNRFTTTIDALWGCWREMATIAGRK